MKNIALLLDHPEKEKHLHYYTLKAFKDAGYHTFVIFFSGNTKDSKLLRREHKVISLGFSPKEYKKFNIKVIIRLEKILKENLISSLA